MGVSVEGSILSETNIAVNFGFCRWSQYITVLADETGCDPGSIIRMAGFLGFHACGLDLITSFPIVIFL